MTLTWEAKVLEGRKRRLSNRCVSTAVEFVVLVRILLGGYCEKDREQNEYIEN